MDESIQETKTPPVLAHGLNPIESVAQPFQIVDGMLIVGTLNRPLIVHAMIDQNLHLSQKNVTATASLLVQARTNRSELRIQNAGTETVFLGLTAGVTTTNGYPLPAGATVAWRTTKALYAIASTGPVLVGVSELYT